MIRKNRVKAKLAAGEKVFGIWLQSASPTFAEISALIGFDAFIMDEEHGPGGVQAAIDMARAASATDATSIVRVPSADPIYIRRILDGGIEGVLVPMVETAEQAQTIADACRFPPLGKRGNAWDITRAAGYGVARDYMKRVHDETLVIVQLETVEGIRNARAIADVEGIDVIFIGPTDLAGSAGVGGDTGHPTVEQLIADGVEAVKPTGKPLATVPRRGTSWQKAFDDGFDFVAAGSEIHYFRLAAEAQFKDWLAYQESKKG